MVWRAREGATVIKLNLPTDLKTWLHEYAAENMRPLNSQIVKELLEVQERVTAESAEQTKRTS